jgi:hypothetical protein
VSGNKLHNIGTVTGTTDQFIASGTYSPTLTIVANIASVSVNVAQWIRVGNCVTVAGRVDIDPTAASVATSLGISLPIASTFPGGVAIHIGGVAARMSTSLAPLCASIIADETNSRATLQFLNDADVANNGWSYHFTYIIL